MPVTRKTRERRGKPWHTVEQSTAPPWIAQPPPSSRPQRPRIELPPGTTLERDEYRPKTASDLIPPLVWSVVLGTLCGTVAGLIGGLRWAAGVASGVAAVSFLAGSFPVVWIDGPGVVAMAERITRRDLDGDGMIGPPPEINLNATLHEGQTSHTARVTMPLTQVRHWRDFCYAYTQGQCEFSGRAAAAHNVDPALFTRVIEQWISRDDQLSLIDPASVGERLTPRPTTQGDAMIAIYAHTPLRELGSLLQQYTGTGRQHTDREG